MTGNMDGKSGKIVTDILRTQFVKWIIGNAIQNYIYQNVCWTTRYISNYFV